MQLNLLFVFLLMVMVKTLTAAESPDQRSSQRMTMNHYNQLWKSYKQNVLKSLII